MWIFGTSMTWLLWDVVFYGNNLFQGDFILALTGEDTSLFHLYAGKCYCYNMCIVLSWIHGYINNVDVCCAFSLPYLLQRYKIIYLKCSITAH